MDSYISIDFSLLYALNLITTFDCEGFFLQNTFALYLMVPPGDMLTLGVDGENAQRLVFVSSLIPTTKSLISH